MKSDAETNVVSRIIADIRDRKGLRQAWDGIDDETRDEIIEEWRWIVRQEQEKAK